jgi:hypothetical protein
MPRTIAPSHRRIAVAACRALMLIGFLALILMAPRLDAQTAPSPSGGDRRPGHDHSGAPAPVPSVPMVPAPSAAAPRFTPQAVGTTNLAGSLEFPGPGDPDGSGTAQVQVDIGNQQVCTTLNVANIATATAAHIHRGPAGVAGPIVVNLPTPVGGSSTGCTPVNQILASEIVANPAGFYVNVHTGDFPNGAIRGQVVLTQPTNLQALLSGASEVPPADVDGAGVAGISIDVNTNQACALISVTNIAAATAAHIHQGAVGVNGPIVVSLPVPTAGSATGCTTGLTPTILQNIVANPAAFYVNIHNGEFPDGAIRGQLETGAPITHVASLTGAAEFPGPGDPDGLGLSTLVIDVTNQRICVGTVVQGITTASASHIHQGAAGVAGPIVVNLPVPDAGGATFGCVTGIPATLIADIANNPASFYVNVHNGDFPDGALRGQLARIAVQTPPCNPRPNVILNSQIVTEGGVARLRVTVASQTSAGNPSNALTAASFTALDGARVSVLPGGPTNQTAPFSPTLPAGATQLQFDVFRATPGQTVTVRLVVTDICGTWPTFVGAGPIVGF